MTPSEYIKSKGLPSLAYVSRQTGVIERTLFNWYHNKHALFIVVIDGCVYQKVADELQERVNNINERERE